MITIKNLEREIKIIKERNKNVEADKSWEISWSRKILIAIFTYVVIVLFCYFVGLPKPWVSSIIPALAFILSTLTLPLFKKAWINYIHKK